MPRARTANAPCERALSAAPTELLASGLQRQRSACWRAAWSAACACWAAVASASTSSARRVCSVASSAAVTAAAASSLRRTRAAVPADEAGALAGADSAVMGVGLARHAVLPTTAHSARTSRTADGSVSADASSAARPLAGARKRGVSCLGDTWCGGGSGTGSPNHSGPWGGVGFGPRAEAGAEANLTRGLAPPRPLRSSKMGRAVAGRVGNGWARQGTCFAPPPCPRAAADRMRSTSACRCPAAPRALETGLGERSRSARAASFVDAAPKRPAGFAGGAAASGGSH